MAVSQRYVSKELTHFIGSNLTREEDQYHLLVKIIKDGNLKGRDVGGALQVALQVHVGTPRMSNNEVFMPNVVCFSDIPVEDLDLHMKKYSHFGLSFLKKDLILKGTNPVFYIAENSVLPNRKTRKEYFDDMIDEFNFIFFHKENKILEVQRESGDNVFESDWNGLKDFLTLYIFSFIKFFDDTKSENDQENYYMEREWRLLGFLKFEIKDICRIILPQEYSERFRKDIPDYFGQITFSQK